MKKILTLIVLTLVMCVAVQAQTTKRDQLVKIAKTLEQSPFGETAKEDRGWAVRWVIETDEVSVVICSNGYTSAFLDKKNKYGSELVAQYTIGMAAFKILNPDQKSVDDAAQLAGIESALRAYEAMVAAKPKAKFNMMDELLAKRANGELTRAAVNCDRKEEK